MPPHATNRSGALRLSDGRRLTFVETGPPDGAPAIYCHGALGSPLRDSVDLGPMTERLNLRHIAVNRPGFGGADLVRGRSITDFAHDLTALADALDLDRVYLVGVSAGGPYALAAAHALKDRVIRAAVCSSLSPLCAMRRTAPRGCRCASASGSGPWPPCPKRRGAWVTPCSRRCTVIPASCIASSPPTPRPPSARA
jgi:pimeloyl-ACP methyl ester carboxylesterase